MCQTLSSTFKYVYYTAVLQVIMWLTVTIVGVLLVWYTPTSFFKIACALLTIFAVGMLVVQIRYTTSDRGRK